jgi:hypothetical protein
MLVWELRFADFASEPIALKRTVGLLSSDSTIFFSITSVNLSLPMFEAFENLSNLWFGILLDSNSFFLISLLSIILRVIEFK